MPKPKEKKAPELPTFNWPFWLFIAISIWWGYEMARIVIDSCLVPWPPASCNPANLTRTD